MVYKLLSVVALAILSSLAASQELQPHVAFAFEKPQFGGYASPIPAIGECIDLLPPLSHNVGSILLPELPDPNERVVCGLYRELGCKHKDLLIPIASSAPDLFADQGAGAETASIECDIHEIQD